MVRVPRQRKFLYRPQPRRTQRAARPLPRDQRTEADPQAGGAGFSNAQAPQGPRGPALRGPRRQRQASDAGLSLFERDRRAVFAVPPLGRTRRQSREKPGLPLGPRPAYGQFLSTIFDEWMRNDIGKIFIQLFDESVRPFLGMEHAL